jgi:hypothetical protein
MSKPVKKPRTLPVRKTITAFMVAMEYEFVSEKTATATSRYTSHRGIPDGDFPNAHQSIATILTTRWELPMAHAEDLVELRKTLVGLGFVGMPWWRGEGLWMDRIGHQLTTTWFCNGRGRRRTLAVEYTSTTQKPDLAYERTGRGRGQVY